jgi:large subunit ribosomal protein L6
MSRLAKKPIAIPEKTEVKVGDGRIVVKGPKGELTRSLHPTINIAVEEGKILVTPKRNDLQTKALSGTYASHVKNMIEGATKGFEKKLEIEGVGYRWEVAGANLSMALGFSHPVKLVIPAGLAVKAEKSVLSISGIDKEVVGQFAATVRAQKEPEPYKGKGIRYSTEVIRRKQGKKTV